MPRAKRIFSSSHPYHVTARCINREWFKLPISQIWEIFNRHLFFVHHAYEGRVHAFTLMNNHFHLLISTPKANLDKIMWYLMKESSREITFHANRINQTFGGPYYACLINSYHYYLHAYKYLYRNPVEAGLAIRVEDYEYSSLYGLLGLSHIGIPLECDEILFNDYIGTLNWLNSKFKEQHRTDIQAALTHAAFCLPKNRNTRNENELETEIS